MIEFRQIYTNQLYDNITREAGLIFDIPPSATITGISTANGVTSHHIPNINDRLSAKQLDAKMEPLGYRILMEAYMTVTYGADEPDELWAGGPDRYTWMTIRDMIITYHTGLTYDRDRATIVRRFGDSELKFCNDMLEGEVLFWNTRHNDMSIRVYNLHIEAPNVNRG